MNMFNHSAFDFDPSYGYSLTQLLNIKTPPEPDNFVTFWRQKYLNAITTQPLPVVKDTGKTIKQMRVFDIEFCSTNHIRLGGWLCLPESGKVERGFIVGHGYGGREEPDYHLPFNHNSAYLFFCARGISRSKQAPISSNPAWHVLHDIDKPDDYIIGGCVEDTWLATSCMLRLYPELSGHLGYLGISFSGGTGALALAWDQRIKKAHFNVPSFGHNWLRMNLKTTGSAASVQKYCKNHLTTTLNTLSYYDAAIAAKYIQQPVHIAAARYDPVVAPPGQFAIFNALNEAKNLFILDAGHTEYSHQQVQEQTLLNQLSQFFSDL